MTLKPKNCDVSIAGRPARAAGKVCAAQRGLQKSTRVVRVCGLGFRRSTLIRIIVCWGGLLKEDIARCIGVQCLGFWILSLFRNTGIQGLILIRVI